MLITVTDTFLFLLLDKYGMRKLEAFFVLKIRSLKNGVIGSNFYVRIHPGGAWPNWSYLWYYGSSLQKLWKWATDPSQSFTTIYFLVNALAFDKRFRFLPKLCLSSKLRFPFLRKFSIGGQQFRFYSKISNFGQNYDFDRIWIIPKNFNFYRNFHSQNNIVFCFF